MMLDVRRGQETSGMVGWSSVEWIHPVDAQAPLHAFRMTRTNHKCGSMLWLKKQDVLSVLADLFDCTSLVSKERMSSSLMHRYTHRVGQ